MFMTICIAYTLTNAFAIAIINGTFWWFFMILS
jgi:hypothetical protein